MKNRYSKTYVKLFFRSAEDDHVASSWNIGRISGRNANAFDNLKPKQTVKMNCRISNHKEIESNMYSYDVVLKNEVAHVLNADGLKSTIT